MPDLENVIKDAENYEPYARVLTSLTIECDLFLNMLALLKEQEERIETLESLRRIEQEGR